MIIREKVRIGDQLVTLETGRVAKQAGGSCLVRAGDTIYVPTAIFHSTRNTGWEPMRLLALYNPAGAEKALAGLPDFREEPAGSVPTWSRA